MHLWCLIFITFGFLCSSVDRNYCWHKIGCQPQNVFFCCNYKIQQTDKSNSTTQFLQFLTQNSLYMECVLLCICPTRWTTLRNMSIAIKATVPVSSQLLSCKNVKVKLCISELAKTQMHIIEAPRLQIEFWPLHHFVAVHQLHLYWWSVTPYK